MAISDAAIRQDREGGHVAYPPRPYFPHCPSTGCLVISAESVKRFRPWSITIFRNGAENIPVQFIAFGGHEGRDAVIQLLMGDIIKSEDS